MTGLVRLVGYLEKLCFLFILLFGTIWTAISSYLPIRSRRRDSWPQTAGTWMFTEVRRVESGSPSTGPGFSITYQPYIKYQYSVGTAKFENATYAVAALPWTADPGPAEAI